MYKYEQCPNCGSRDSQRVIYFCYSCEFRGCWDNRGGGCWPGLTACPKCGKTGTWSKSGDVR